ncbi:hypothetical protein KIW84_032642 [Lathyrus oleraceus]|uniref:Integrase catalytic domain-containing protein n=1 Tax=Pisum sativum TaxID=3888 RepID=A0A9D4XVF6_PEA|nr:hypothetical protein KIW84_032642 [Pisum sativum]
MNGAVEAANKNIKKIVQKMVVTYKDLHEMLPFALHGYRTSVRTSTGATPYSLVYGMEAVLPVEVEIPSLRVLLAAICHGQLYQSRMKRAFDQKVRPRCFQVGDLVLKRIIPPQTDHRGKWTPNYEGPYIVTKVFDGGALMLATMDGEDFTSPVLTMVLPKHVIQTIHSPVELTVSDCIFPAELTAPDCIFPAEVAAPRSSMPDRCFQSQIDDLFPGSITSVPYRCLLPLLSHLS